jgi:hypothetical protein
MAMAMARRVTLRALCSSTHHNESKQFGPPGSHHGRMDPVIGHHWVTRCHRREAAGHGGSRRGSSIEAPIGEAAAS